MESGLFVESQIKEKSIMTPAELAEYLGKDERTLLRFEEKGLKACNWSNKTKFYLFEDVIEFMRGLQK